MKQSEILICRLLNAMNVTIIPPQSSEPKSSEKITEVLIDEDGTIHINSKYSFLTIDSVDKISDVLGNLDHLKLSDLNNRNLGLLKSDNS